MKHFLTFVAAIWMFLEEVIWESCKRAMSWVGRLPLITQLEQFVASQPRYIALFILILLPAHLLPLKFIGLHYIAQGKIMLGLAVFSVAKIIGTALFARVFVLTRPQLMTFPWFATCYYKITGLRDRLYTYVKSTPIWQALLELREFVREVKTFLKELITGKRTGSNLPPKRNPGPPKRFLECTCLTRLISQKMTSGNDVPVSRCIVTLNEYESSLTCPLHTTTCTCHFSDMRGCPLHPRI